MKSKCCGVKIFKSKIKVIVSRLNLQQIFFIYCKIQQSNIANIVYYYFYIFIFFCFLAILIIYICIYILLSTLYFILYILYFILYTLYLLVLFQLVHLCLCFFINYCLLPCALALVACSSIPYLKSKATFALLRNPGFFCLIFVVSLSSLRYFVTS
jgi:hypothetical protein